MSRGLGIAQRQLLGALYVAPDSDEFWQWDVVSNTTQEDPVSARRRRLVADGELAGREFYAVAELHLAEGRDPQLRNAPPHSIDDYNNMRPADGESTLDERNIRRSWRALYRRAADGLAVRGLIDTVLATVTLDDLDVFTYWSFFGHSDPPPVRTITLARITGDGVRYVEQHRAQLVKDMSILSDELRRVLREKGFLDIAESPKRPPRRRPARQRPRERRNTEPTRSHRNPVAIEPDKFIEQSIQRDALIARLVSEGFEPDHVGAAIRAWHRDDQRQSRRLFGDNGIPLHKRVFDLDEIQEVRRRLTD